MLSHCIDSKNPKVSATKTWRIILLSKCAVIKYLVLLKIQNVIDINADFLQQFINFLVKKLLVE